MNEPGTELDSLFPMPLSSMEKMHLFDNSANFPNEIFGRLRFEGRLDRQAAVAAVEKTIERQRILGLKIDQSNGRFNWFADIESPPPILFQDFDQTEIPPIDLEHGFPWRVIFRSGDKQTEIWFQASHALFDGLGAIQLITNWSNFYHLLTSPAGKKPKRLHRLDYQQLKQRNSLGLLSRRYLMNLWKQPIGLLGAMKFIGRRPAQAYPHTADKPWNHDVQPAVIGCWLESDIVQGIAAAAQTLSVRTNSIFVGQLIKTLEKVAAENPQRDSAWIRIVHPMSFRTIADRKMPACNRTTIVQIDRKKEEFDDEWFYKNLDREIAIIHGWELSKLFLLAIKALSLMPGLLKSATQTDKCRGTCVYANLGEPLGRLGFPKTEQEQLKIGSLTLVDFDFVGPVRRKTPINFSVQKHLRRYRLSLHYDPRLVDKHQSDLLLDSYREALISFAT